MQEAILLSDQGFQYTSKQYNKLINETWHKWQPLSQRKLP
ncbi:hypothetical protein BLGI_2307 [Brevibacillus laterosporus GI-9]|nr:hypothetical protein BLGI_2307 [Brevibacillus laterosporus GI-9]